MAASNEILAYDKDSADNYYYHDVTDDYLHPLQGNDKHDDDDENALEEDDTDDLPTFPQNYIVLTETDIRERIKDNIAEVSGVLSVSKTEASILLRHYNWSLNQLFDAWFADEKLVREKVGLFVKNELSDHAQSGHSMVCGNCFEDYPYVKLKSTSCGHLYCDDCWSSYFKKAIADGPRSLLLKCPEPSCRAAVREDMIGLFASEEEKIKYDCYIELSYIEPKKKMIKWCPGPGFENAVERVSESESFDVTCLCSHSFCWNCNEEAHRPVDCETVMKWKSKNSLEFENVNYILAFTKPCPKCKRPIGKNHGSAHMTCRAPCSYQFCWLCLHDWRNHGACNRFEGNPVEGKREKVKEYMMKYTHYFERWATNQNSMQKAVANLKNVLSKWIEIVGRIHAQPAARNSFLTEAWKQIIECRRVLTWTYAYGIYLPGECETTRNLF